MAKKLGKFLVSKVAEWWKIKKSFSADGESHSFRFDGEKRAARAIVASDPTPLSQFIAKKKTEAGLTPTQKAAISGIEAQIPIIDKAKALPEDKYAQAQKDIEAASAAIVPLLIQLLSGVDFGSAENPLPLDYTKRRAGKYPLIYIGPLSGKRIEQAWLQNKDIAQIDKGLTNVERAEWKKRNNEIKTYYPTKIDSLPNGGGPIGMSEPFKVEVGLRVEYSSGKTKGGGLINSTLRPFGYVAGSEKNDGDHIVEMQIGGPNELRNLWPLERGENRSSGSLLKNAIDAAKKKVKPSKKAAVNKDHFFIIISGTRT